VLRLRKKTALPLLAPALAAMVALSACGSKDQPDLAAGKQLFTQKCGACHILNNAGTKGTQGPNLDLAFAEDIRDGLGRSTIEGVVRGQIKVPQGGVMPAKLVEGKQATDVSAYVADAIGKKAGASAGGGPSGTAKANAQNVVEIPTDPTGQLAYKFKNASAKAGMFDGAPIAHSCHSPAAFARLRSAVGNDDRIPDGVRGGSPAFTGVVAAGVGHIPRRRALSHARPRAARPPGNTLRGCPCPPRCRHGPNPRVSRS